MQILVECGWIEAGPVVLLDDRLKMPALPAEPGVYQWVLSHAGRERRYVGEAENLARRFQQYRTPGPSQGTNQRMNKRARRVLEAGGEIMVLVASTTITRAGASHPADLRSKHVRCLIENAALVDVMAEVGQVINDRGYGDLSNDPILG